MDGMTQFICIGVAYAALQQEFYLTQDFALQASGQGLASRMAAMQNEREICHTKPLKSFFDDSLR
jgi:hypothetical protein